MQVLRNITVDEATSILAASFRPARRTSVNAFLIHSAGRLALVDTGSGTYLLPTAGKVLANIRAAGVDPASIDTVILTHMHPDHSAGLADRNTGQRYFPNAELSCTSASPCIGSTMPIWRTEPIAKSGNFSRPGASRSRPTRIAGDFSRRGEVSRRHRHPRPGHTPGHTTYGQLRQGAAPDLGRHRPRARGADGAAGGVHGLRTDKDLAARTIAVRRSTWPRRHRLLVTGMHLHFPGFAHLVRDGSGYRLIPEAWQHGL